MSATGLDIVDEVGHLGAQTPLLVRGLYYDQRRPTGSKT
jgi:hypothetical protein